MHFFRLNLSSTSRLSNFTHPKFIYRSTFAKEARVKELQEVVIGRVRKTPFKTPARKSTRKPWTTETLPQSPKDLLSRFCDRRKVYSEAYFNQGCSGCICKAWVVTSPPVCLLGGGSLVCSSFLGFSVCFDALILFWGLIGTILSLPSKNTI